jgi:copper chaperone
MIEKTYTVTGMTCGCCANSVSKGVGAIDGVTDVAVDVSTGRVTVTSADELGADTVRVAVEEAGYQLTA